MVSMEEVPQDASGGRMTQLPGAIMIAAAEYTPVRLRFRMNVAHSLAARDYTENIIVKIIAENGCIGYGECVPRSYVTGETADSVGTFLNTLLPDITGRIFSSPDETVLYLSGLATLPGGSENPAARCALELALLDCLGKCWNQNVSEIIGLKVALDSLRYSMVIPFLDEAARDALLLRAKEFGFRDVKIKVDADKPSAPVRRARNILGDDMELRVDANCAWNRDTAPGFMRELAGIGVVSVEEPLPADDLEGLVKLKANGLPMITLDESVTSLEAVHRIADMKAADVLNIRISKCGGMLAALRMIEVAEKRGLKVQLGAQVGESCVLSAAGAILAAVTPSFLWREGCFGMHLLQDDLCSGQFQFGEGGIVGFPDGPGLGIEIDPDSIADAAR